MAIEILRSKMGQAVTQNDRRAMDASPRSVVAFHKPTGVVTTRSDPAGRVTVYHYLTDLPTDVAPVGRLDRDTSGLLILTDDGALSLRLKDPSHGTPKTYHARVTGIPDEASLRTLREGHRDSGRTDDAPGYDSAARLGPRRHVLA